MSSAVISNSDKSDMNSAVISNSDKSGMNSAVISNSDKSDMNSAVISNSDYSGMNSAVITRPAASCLRPTCRRAAAADDGGDCVRWSRSGDRANRISLPSSRLKRQCSNIVIASLIAVWLLPEVSAANPTGTNATSSSWSPTGDNSISKQTSTILRDSTRGLFLLYRRGDNDKPSPSGYNSSVDAPTPPIQHVLLGDGFRNTSMEKGGRSAPSTSAGPREEDTASKIVSIVVPFTCVILVAGSLAAAYKLCHRYRCYRNEAGLRKCLAFCDRCLSTPYVFQLPDAKKDSNSTSPVSSDSGRLFRYSFTSVSSSSSRTSTTLSPLTNHTYRNAGLTTTAQYTPIRHSSSSSAHSGASGHVSTSSRNSLRSNTPSRQSSTVTLLSSAASVGSAVVYQTPRQPEARLGTSGHLQRPSFHLSRPPLTPASSRTSIHSRGSVQSRPQAHRGPGGISRRQNSLR
ncbi:hypothetical protein BsWGS_14447 [Bradybaena similaris]